ncbi:hypothetical protein ACFP2T_27605 [Plantactinospora solaniradicis]|uniref:Uncharacterized protein n=1 Tax=Plantactinospora solaniradicis TaxID=1723736 RepID=A0ABW1KDU1_9ACTN
MDRRAQRHEPVDLRVPLAVAGLVRVRAAVTGLVGDLTTVANTLWLGRMPRDVV